MIKQRTKWHKRKELRRERNKSLISASSFFNNSISISISFFLSFFCHRRLFHSRPNKRIKDIFFHWSTLQSLSCCKCAMWIYMWCSGVRVNDTILLYKHGGWGKKLCNPLQNQKKSEQMEFWRFKGSKKTTESRFYLSE